MMDIHFETLWVNLTKRHRGRARFDNYIGKHRTVDSFISSLWRPDRPVGSAIADRIPIVGPKPIIGYGDGRFGPGGRGERNVPTKFFLRRTRLQYEVVMVDENFTTKKCCDCEGVLVPAFRLEENQRVCLFTFACFDLSESSEFVVDFLHIITHIMNRQHFLSLFYRLLFFFSSFTLTFVIGRFNK